MRVLILIAIGYAIVAFVKFIKRKIEEAGNGGLSKEEAAIMQHGFKGRVRLRMEQLDDGSEVEVFECQIKGIIVGQYEEWGATLRTGLIDVTESRDGSYPVLCAIDAFCRPETCIFEFGSEPQQVGEVSYIEEWMTLFTVPTDALQFPKQGQRKLLFFFGVTDDHMVQLDQNFDEVEIEFRAMEQGYIEMDEICREVDRLTVQLAVLVSAADGVLDKAEGKVVQDWIKKRVSMETNDERIAEIKAELNGAVKEAAGMQDDISGSVVTITQQIAKTGVTAQKFDALELCLEVAGADGTAEETELNVIEEIAQGLEVDAERLKNMVQKALPVGMFANKDPDSVLGITSDMTPQEVRKLLNAEYRKWNSRASHNDKKVREQASEMLALIADARKRHVG